MGQAIEKQAFMHACSIAMHSEMDKVCSLLYIEQELVGMDIAIEGEGNV